MRLGCAYADLGMPGARLGVTLDTGSIAPVTPSTGDRADGGRRRRMITGAAGLLLWLGRMTHGLVG